MYYYYYYYWPLTSNIKEESLWRTQFLFSFCDIQVNICFSWTISSTMKHLENYTHKKNHNVQWTLLPIMTPYSCSTVLWISLVYLDIKLCCPVFSQSYTITPQYCRSKTDWITIFIYLHLTNICSSPEGETYKGCRCLF